MPTIPLNKQIYISSQEYFKFTKKETKCIPPFKICKIKKTSKKFILTFSNLRKKVLNFSRKLQDKNIRNFKFFQDIILFAKMSADLEKLGEESRDLLGPGDLQLVLLRLLPE